MVDHDDARRPRTLLAAKIGELGLTLEEFAVYAEDFAREHGERGTLSVRHLQRLISARERPATLRPATRRLLEAIFATPVVELLGPARPAVDGSPRVNTAATVTEWEQQAAEVARLVATSARVDPETVDLLASQVENTRRLDRRFGAATLLGALRLHAEHIEHLLTYATDTRMRHALAVVLTDAHTLAGWQSLDRGQIGHAWCHYGNACDAALITGSPALYAHALAEQAVVLADVGRAEDGVTMSENARIIGRSGAPLLRAWLAAAHGEALTADGRHGDSRRAFDRAAEILPSDCTPDGESPYMALDPVHLARWRGHALARVGDTDAVPVLTGALHALDAEFTRAEAALRVDLTCAHLAAKDMRTAAEQSQLANSTAESIGSIRQRQRLICMWSPSVHQNIP